MSSNNLGPETGASGSVNLELHDRVSSAPLSSEEVDAQLSDTDRKFLAWLRRRMLIACCNYWFQWTRAKFHWVDEAGGWLSKKVGSADKKGPWALLTFVLALLVATFGILEYFHMKEPTLRAAREQTAATIAQGAAAEWANYQTWVMNVCPSELARNVTSTPCEGALDGPILPPPKPQYIEQQSLFFAAAKTLSISYNAASAIESDLLDTDNRCGNNAASSSESCSSIQMSRVFSKRDTDTHGLGQLNKTDFFPLPSRGKLASIKLWIWGMPRTTSLFAQDLVILALVHVLALVQARHKQSSLFSVAASGSRRYHIFYRVEIGLLGVVVGRSYSVLGSLWRLRRELSKDLFLERCLRAKTVSGDSTTECLRIMAFSTGLPAEAEVISWSAWRGYYYVKIAADSTDNTVLLCSLSMIAVLSIMLICLWRTKTSGAGYKSLPTWSFEKG